MPKSLHRLIAVLLVQSLLVDPVTATCFQSFPRVGSQSQSNLFAAEALSLHPIWMHVTEQAGFAFRRLFGIGELAYDHGRLDQISHGAEFADKLPDDIFLKYKKGDPDKPGDLGMPGAPSKRAGHTAIHKALSHLYKATRVVISKEFPAAHMMLLQLIEDLINAEESKSTLELMDRWEPRFPSNFVDLKIEDLPKALMFAISLLQDVNLRLIRLLNRIDVVALTEGQLRDPDFMDKRMELHAHPQEISVRVFFDRGLREKLGPASALFQFQPHEVPTLYALLDQLKMRFPLHVGHNVQLNVEGKAKRYENYLIEPSDTITAMDLGGKLFPEQEFVEPPSSGFSARVKDFNPEMAIVIEEYGLPVRELIASVATGDADAHEQWTILEHWEKTPPAGVNALDITGAKRAIAALVLFQAMVWPSDIARVINHPDLNWDRIEAEVRRANTLYADTPEKISDVQNRAEPARRAISCLIREERYPLAPQTILRTILSSDDQRFMSRYLKVGGDRERAAKKFKISVEDLNQRHDAYWQKIWRYFLRLPATEKPKKNGFAFIAPIFALATGMIGFAASFGPAVQHLLPHAVHLALFAVLASVITSDSSLAPPWNPQQLILGLKDILPVWGKNPPEVVSFRGGETWPTLEYVPGKNFDGWGVVLQSVSPDELLIEQQHLVGDHKLFYAIRFAPSSAALLYKEKYLSNYITLGTFEGDRPFVDFGLKENRPLASWVSPAFYEWLTTKMEENGWPKAQELPLAFAAIGSAAPGLVLPDAPKSTLQDRMEIKARMDYLRANGRKKEIIPYLTALLDVYKDDLTLLTMTATKCIAFKQYREAFALLLRAEKLVPNDPRIHMFLANAYSETNDFDAAIRHAKIQCELEPTRGRAWFSLAEIYKFAGDQDVQNGPSQQALEIYKLALSAVDKAIQLDPEFQPSYRLLNSIRWAIQRVAPAAAPETEGGAIGQGSSILKISTVRVTGFTYTQSEGIKNALSHLRKLRKNLPSTALPEDIVVLGKVIKRVEHLLAQGPPAIGAFSAQVYSSEDYLLAFATSERVGISRELFHHVITLPQLAEVLFHEGLASLTPEVNKQDHQNRYLGIQRRLFGDPNSLKEVLRTSIEKEKSTPDSAPQEANPAPDLPLIDKPMGRRGLIKGLFAAAIGLNLPGVAKATTATQIEKYVHTSLGDVSESATLLSAAGNILTSIETALSYISDIPTRGLTRRLETTWWTELAQTTDEWAYHIREAKKDSSSPLLSALEQSVQGQIRQYHAAVDGVSQLPEGAAEIGGMDLNEILTISHEAIEPDSVEGAHFKMLLELRQIGAILRSMGIPFKLTPTIVNHFQDHEEHNHSGTRSSSEELPLSLPKEFEKYTTWLIDYLQTPLTDYLKTQNQRLEAIACDPKVALNYMFHEVRDQLYDTLSPRNRIDAPGPTPSLATMFNDITTNFIHWKFLKVESTIENKFRQLGLESEYWQYAYHHHGDQKAWEQDPIHYADKRAADFFRDYFAAQLKKDRSFKGEANRKAVREKMAELPLDELERDAHTPRALFQRLENAAMNGENSHAMSKFSYVLAEAAQHQAITVRAFVNSKRIIWRLGWRDGNGIRHWADAQTRRLLQEVWDFRHHEVWDHRSEKPPRLDMLPGETILRFSITFAAGTSQRVIDKSLRSNPLIPWDETRWRREGIVGFGFYLHAAPNQLTQKIRRAA